MKQIDYRILFTAAAFIAYAAIFGVAGEADIQEELHQADRYCDMVEAGAWPDYENRYDEDCAGGDQ